jgi:two-component system sensor histidine kinase PilS (NtrC family)
VSRRGVRLGLRREAPILMPAALALFAILGVTTLVSYRVAVERFALERQNEARALAERFAERARDGRVQLDAWRRELPPGAALALLDEAGAPVAASGLDSDEPLPPELIAGARGGVAVAYDPSATRRPAVVALVPLAGAGAARTLRLDLPAHALAAQRRSLALLTPLVVGLTIAASIVVALFLRALLRPYDTLLERARAAGPAAGPATGAEAGDELDFLVATFDRALAALGAPAGDLAPLAGTLGRELEGGFLLLDPERRLLVATPAAIEVLEVPPPPPGSALSEAFGSEPELAGELERALAAGLRVPRGALRLAGGRRTVGYTAEPLRGEGGRSRGWLVVVADLTEHERQEARERLADGLAQLGELSAGVAHELRNGLAALRGWIELARRRPAEAEELLGEVDRESRELTRVVDDFLAFARPGTRRREPCDLVAILGRVAAGAARPQVAVRFEPPGRPAPLEGDALLLERALRNVVANAVRAERDAGRSGPIELALEPLGDSYRITVADRGAGIPLELRPRLFEPFATGRPDGVGLGLALARRIVVLHGGEIAARDRGEGGTEVEVVLPRVVSDTFRS